MEERHQPTEFPPATKAILEHPRHRFGKRAQAGVPHTGWECLFIEDLEESRQLCAMCESQEVRYVFHMRHPDYSDILEVGCECAEMMGSDGDEARRRLREMKKRGRRRAQWLDGWNVSARGNEWRGTAGYRIIILANGEHWTFKIVRTSDDYELDATTMFSTPNEAKLAAFDLLWPAVSPLMLRGAGLHPAH